MRGLTWFSVPLTLLVAPVTVSAVDGTNLPGRDYTHFPAPSAMTCRHSCGGDAQCQAYTWVKPGIQGPGGVCWLKSSEPPIVKDTCCDSSPRRFITKANMGPEDRTHRPGLDYRNFTAAWTTSPWRECEQACAGEDQCRSWTYVRPGVQGPQGRCWLKSRVAAPVSDANTVSGVKYRPAAVRFD